MEGKESILIVDDDESTCKSLSLVFGMEGYETETAGTGQEAIEKARERLFNLALLDIRLPDMEGVELLAPLKEVNSDMVMIMATAYASLDTAVRALNEGASAYIHKPLNMDAVLATVSNVLEKQRLVIENRRLYQEAQRELAGRKRAEEALKRSNRKLLAGYKQRKLLSKRLITLLENDRRAVAMELHDHLGQTLTTLRMDLEMILGQLSPSDSTLKDSIQLIHKKAILAMEDVHNMARGLRPTMLDTLGLVPAFRGLFNDIKQYADLEIHFFSQDLPKRFDPEKELAIYRIAQEALTNIVKHARSNKVFVNLTKEDNFIALGVEDNGVGFDQEDVMKVSNGKGPLGLLIMRQRAGQLNGEFSIESRIGGGTHLLTRIPL